MKRIHANELKVGDKILAWCPRWVKNVIHEMEVVGATDTLVKLKESTSDWWLKKDIIVHELINRKVAKVDEEAAKKGFKQKFIDIEEVKIGDRILYTFSHTEHVWEDTVQDIKESVICLKGSYSADWEDKSRVQVLEICGRGDVITDSKESCPFMSDVNAKVACNTFCRLYKNNGCIFEEMSSKLCDIEANTDDDDDC